MEAAADLYLLAHPDDDLWVRPLIARNPARAHIAYLSASDGGGRFLVEVRAREVKACLAPLHVAPERISFIGADNGIPDGHLHEHLEKAYAAVERHAASVGPIGRIITHAWEGGHPDHDACHLVAGATARKLGIAEHSLAVPGYRRPASGFPPFIVFAPLAGNGAIDRLSLSMGERLGVVRSMFSYPSQWKTFVGLGPLIAGHAVFGSGLPLQSLAASRAPERPQTTTLLFEQRNGLSFEAFSSACAAFVNDHRDRKAAG